MADQFDPVSAFVQLGQSQSASSQGAATTTPDSKPQDIVSSFVNLGQQQKGDQEKANKDAAYEQKIQSYAPEAEKNAEAQWAGKPPSIPILSTAVDAAGRAIGASLGYGKGSNFSERYNDLSAWEEAMDRAMEKKHPIQSTINDIAGAAVLPIGEIAAPVEAGAAALGLGKTTASALGMGTEAGAISGASQFTENQLGTKPESEKGSTLGATLTGAAFGAGLPIAGKAASLGYENIIPDSIKAAFRNDSYQYRKIADAWAQDIADGTARMTPDELQSAISQGHPVNIFSAGGTNMDNLSRSIFKGNKDAADVFANNMYDRLLNKSQSFPDFVANNISTINHNPEDIISGATERFRDTVNDMADTAGEGYINTDKLKTQAKKAAKEASDAEFQKAWDNNNPEGHWNPSWNEFLNDPDFASSVHETNNTMSRLYGDSFQPPIRPVGELGVEALGLDPTVTQRLREAGVSTIAQAQSASKSLPKILYQAPEDAAVEDLARQQTQSAAEDVEKAVEGINPRQLTVVDPKGVGVEYLDRLQREVKQASNPYFANPAKYEIGEKVKGMANDITSDLRDPESPRYSENYDRAAQNYQNFRGESNAHDVGLDLLGSLNKNDRLSKNANIINNMNDQEKSVAQKTVLASFMDQASRSKTPVNLTKYFEDPLMDQNLQTLFGPEKYARLRGQIYNEANISRANQIANDLIRPGLKPNILSQHIKELENMDPIHREIAKKTLMTHFNAIAERKGGDALLPFMQGSVGEALNHVFGPDELEKMEKFARFQALAKKSTAEASQLGSVARNSRIQDLLLAITGFHGAAGLNFIREELSSRLGKKYAENFAQKLSSGDIDEIRQLMSQAKNNSKISSALEAAWPKINSLLSRGAGTLGGKMFSTGGPVEPQKITSAKTSLNQVPALFKSPHFQTSPNHRNVDIGGGAYDTGTQFLRDERGVDSKVLDKFNRSDDHNKAVAYEFASNPADSATLANVLNVIPERVHRLGAIRDAHVLTKPDAKAYFGIYEGDRSGVGKETSKGWQNNLPAESYMDEVREHFPHVERKGNIIIGHKVPPVRVERSTGGRIPEMDKLFKQAKKYVDSHTKNILNAPDDVVVRALHIAKRKV